MEFVNPKDRIDYHKNKNKKVEAIEDLLEEKGIMTKKEINIKITSKLSKK